MKTRTIIVDEQDNLIGLKEAGTLGRDDIYKITALWLADKGSGDILLAQRGWRMEHDPGKWAAAVAGTVDEGETYEMNIVKEIQEEIGLVNLKLTKGPKQFVDDGRHKYFCQWFLAQVDKDNTKIIPQEEEVEAVRWLSKADLLEELKTKPDNFVPSMTDALKTLGFN